MTTVVFTDSRGTFLADEIFNISGEMVTVCHYPGVRIEGLAKKIWCYTRSHSVSTAYIMAGINDITSRDPNTRDCSTLFESPGELREYMTELYISLLRYCYQFCNIDYIVICTMTGISLSRYNRNWGPEPSQWIINWGVRLLNENIIANNGAHGFHSPCLHQVIHLTQHHPYRCRDMYNRLRDGLHPSRTTLRRWAHGLVRCMRLNNHL